MNSNPLLKKKIFLYVTEFLSGIAVMGVETAASRLLAPYFSSSQVVYTLIIGVILIAMSLGNFLGGRMADKHPDVTRLYVFILFAGAYICLIPFVGRYVIVGVAAFCALFVSSGLVIWASIIVCLLLFVPPLLILGMITPSLVKYCMGEKASGKVVGLMEALNTIGSIFGTFLPTFVTIPLIGTSWSFALFGGLLCLVALVFIITGFIHNHKENKNLPKEEKEIRKDKKLHHKSLTRGLLSFAYTCLAIVGVVLAGQSKYVFWDDSSHTIVYEKESIYNYLQVKEDDEGVYLSTNVLFGIQSMVKKDGSLTGMYYDSALAAPYMAGLNQKQKLSCLILGNATGTYATLMNSYLPYEHDILGVEIDQDIIDLSYEYFNMDEDVEVVCDDGRNYLNLHDEKYDLIMVDAYSSISVPFQMASVEFFSMVKEHLTDDGVMVMNINMASRSEDGLDQALSDTVYDSFDYVYKYQVPGQSNDELFASNNPDMMNLLYEAIDTIDDTSFKSIMQAVYNDASIHEDTGIRLTDDNADVELRSMSSVDEIIMNELSFYRTIYEERGLSGLLDYLFGA